MSLNPSVSTIFQFQGLFSLFLERGWGRRNREGRKEPSLDLGVNFSLYPKNLAQGEAGMEKMPGPQTCQCPSPRLPCLQPFPQITSTA